MLKIMRSNKLKRFIAVLFVLLSVFSMCFSVAAKAEAVTVGVGAVVVIGALLTACGIKFANSADTSRAVEYVYRNLSDGLKAVVSGLVALCEGYQSARLQIPYAVFEVFSNLFASLFPANAVSGGSVALSPVVLSGAVPYVSYGNTYYAAAPINEFQVRWTKSDLTAVVLGYSSWQAVTSYGFYSVSLEAVKTSTDVSYYYNALVRFDDGASFTVRLPMKVLFDSSKANGDYTFFITPPVVDVSGGYFCPPSVGPQRFGDESKWYGAGFNRISTFSVVASAVGSNGLSIPCGADASSDTFAKWAYSHYAASLQKNEDVLNYGVSRNPALSTNPDCTFPQTVDGSKDVYMDIPALKDTSLDDLITKNPADVATPADTKVENPTLVEGADTNVGEGDVTVPSDASWLDKILAFLKALLDGILSIPGVISKGIAGVLDGIKAIPAAFAKWFESIIEGIKAIGLSFTDWLSKLIEGFKSLLLSLFEPTISLDEAFAALKAKALAKFPTDGLIDSISAFRDYLSGLGDTPPSFTFVYMGNTCTIAPFDWLSGYRRYWIAFASFFMWFGFIRRTIKRMPQLLGGIT